MEALKTVIPLVFAASLFLLVLKVGLDAEPGDLTSAFRKPGRLARAILAVNIIVPVFAILLVQLTALSSVSTAGILLMAISPAPPLVPGKQLKVGGQKSDAYGLYTALILLAVVFVPLWAVILGRLYGIDMVVPFAPVLRNVLLTVLLPLLLGVAIRRAAPALAARAIGPLGKIATILLLAALAPILMVVLPAFAKLVGDGTVLVMALVVVVGLVAGHLLGGPTAEDRATLAVTAATRHPGIAMAVAGVNALDPRVNAAILGFLLVGILAGAPYQIWIKRRAAAGADRLTSGPTAG